MTSTETISSIDINESKSWQGKVFLTFDIDWAHDIVLLDTIDLLESAGVSATLFVTHETKLLERLRANNKFELGVHPNFNFLLDAKGVSGGNAKQVVEQILALVPEAKSVRSHSMTQNSRLLDIFKESGLTHDVNHFIPAHTNIELCPWYLWNGLCRIPYFWEDDIACMYSLKDNMEELALSQSLKVFDFHPIHIFLNTEHLDRYERTRHLHSNPNELIKHRYEGEGTRTRLIELLKLVDEPYNKKEL